MGIWGNEYSITGYSLIERQSDNIYQKIYIYIYIYKIFSLPIIPGLGIQCMEIKASVYKALYSRIALQPWKNVGTKGIPINRRMLDKA